MTTPTDVRRDLVAEAMVRFEAAWDELDREPIPGDISWFLATPEGEQWLKASRQGAARSSSRLCSDQAREKRIRAMSKRILGRMECYKPAAPAAGESNLGKAPPGQVLGQYSNPGGYSILVTTRGLVVEDHTPRFVEYAEMEDISPPPKGPLSGTIRVRLPSGEVWKVDVLGGDEKIRDVYQFTRFLLRAAELSSSN